MNRTVSNALAVVELGILEVRSFWGALDYSHAGQTLDHLNYYRKLGRTSQIHLELVLVDQVG